MSKYFRLIILVLSQNLCAQIGIFDHTPNVSSSYTLGNFDLQWLDSSRELVIKDRIISDKVVWKSIHNVPFLYISKGTEKIVEERGSFVIHEHTSDTLSVQDISSFEKTDSTLSIYGNLRSSNFEVPYIVAFKVVDDQLQFTISIEDEDFDRIYLQYASEADEAIMGFGEQYSHFNHKNNLVPILVNEQGIGRGDIDDPIILAVLNNSSGDDYTTYKPVPQYITSYNKGFFLETYRPSEFDLRSSTSITVKIYDHKVSGRLLRGNSPKELIRSYTKYCGRMKVLPDWIHEGAIVGIQGGTEKLKEEWQRLKASETPIAAFWIQDWVGQRTTLLGKQLWWNWELDITHYDDYDKLFLELKAQDIKMMGYINPFSTEVYNNKDYYRRRLYKEAKDNDFLVKDTLDKIYEVQNSSFASGVLDLTNPITQRWVKDIIIDEMIAKGFSGWMADFGEAMPYDVHIYDADKKDIIHNEYPEIWARLNQEAIAECGKQDDYVYFMRAAYTQSPKYCTLFWEGDQLLDWGKNDGIKSAVVGLLSSGISGFSINHSDIGGYTNISYPIVRNYNRSNELLRRWTEMNAFTSVFRTHEGLNPQKNAQVYDNDDNARHFAYYAKMYKSLAFYRKQLMVEAAATGIPVNRAMYLEFPSDTSTLDLSYEQFMLGSEFIVAPILDKNVQSKNVYLPEGRWRELWSGIEYISTGQWISFSGRIDNPVVLYHPESEVARTFKNNLLLLGIELP